MACKVGVVVTCIWLWVALYLSYIFRGSCYMSGLRYYLSYITTWWRAIRCNKSEVTFVFVARRTDGWMDGRTEGSVPYHFTPGFASQRHGLVNWLLFSSFNDAVATAEVKHV